MTISSEDITRRFVRLLVDVFIREFVWSILDSGVQTRLVSKWSLRPVLTIHFGLHLLMLSMVRR